MATRYKKTDKMNRARDFINMYLKDPTLFCKCCGKRYIERPVPCCNDPYIVDNMRDIQDYIQANREERASLVNVYGASETGNIRQTIRMPEGLMRGLQRMFASTGEEFLVEKSEAYKFMREFPQFSVARKV